MIHAYDERYLDDAMKNLGEAVDYAVNACHIRMQEFLELFASSAAADQFGRGVPKVIAGISGTELALDVFQKSGREIPFSEPQEEYSYSAAYWCGWILAYYQWFSGTSFKNILRYVSAETLERLYPTMHETSEEKCVDSLNRIFMRNRGASRLQIQRKAYGYTQKELSEKSGVNLRTLQQYELRTKDINKASGVTLSALAKTLGCRIEDLFEIDCK